jgi:hypothetical protein
MGTTPRGRGRTHSTLTAPLSRWISHTPSLAKVLPRATRVELPGLDHGAIGNTDRGGKPELVAQTLRQFYG